MLSQAGLQLPLPARLRRALECIPRQEGQAPLPQIAVPPGLALRLHQLAEGGARGRRGWRAGRPPPLWLRSARYAVAASCLLTLAAGSAFGGPAALSRDLVESLNRFSAAPAPAGSSSHRPGPLETFAGTVAAGCGAASRSLHASVEGLGQRLTRATEELLAPDHSNRKRKR
jgi:hypothetical protein